MRHLALSILLLFLCGPAQAALHFPALTGRVVDGAHILSPETIHELDHKLADYEQGTSNQVVVVTLPTLENDTIEDYGYQLGRAWGIGGKGKNNGLLLIVAPHERKVRIEVGYGLEPVMTDIASSEIINGIILPDFKAGKLEQGINDGVDAIVSVLGGKSMPSVQEQQPNYKDSPIFGFLILGLLLFVAIRHPWLTLFFLSSSRMGGSSGSGCGGGGFSGGGGSFGGGGSSGSW